MQAKNVLYAAVGAPVVAARKVTERVGGLRSKINEEATDYGKAAEKAMQAWAVEGEKVVSRVTDNERVEELAARVDLDQAKEQVGKLRTQLEDMLDTWRSSFRPERTGENVEVTQSSSPAAKPAAKASATKPAAKAATKPAAKASATKPAAKAATKPAAKAAAKKPAPKKPAAKKPTAKTAASKTAKPASAGASAAKTGSASASKAS